MKKFCLFVDKINFAFRYERHHDLVSSCCCTSERSTISAILCQSRYLQPDCITLPVHFEGLDCDLSPVWKTRRGSVIFDPIPGAHSERVSADRGWPEKSAPGRFHLHFPDTVHILQIKTYRHWKQPNKRWERTHNNLSSQHTGLGVLQLFCSVCLSWFKPHLHLIPEKTDSGTITECLLGNGSCVLHRTLTSPGCYGNTPWEAVPMLLWVDRVGRPISYCQKDWRPSQRANGATRSPRHSHVATWASGVTISFEGFVDRPVSRFLL